MFTTELSLEILSTSVVYWKKCFYHFVKMYLDKEYSFLLSEQDIYNQKNDPEWKRPDYGAPLLESFTIIETTTFHSYKSISFYITLSKWKSVNKNTLYSSLSYKYDPRYYHCLIKSQYKYTTLEDYYIPVGLYIYDHYDYYSTSECFIHSIHLFNSLECISGEGSFQIKQEGFFDHL